MSDNTKLDGLVNDYLTHKEAIDKHTVMCEQLAAQIVDALGVGGRHEIMPGVGVMVTKPAARYDEATARKALTAEQLAAITTTVEKLDFKAAEKLWGSALLDQMRKTSGKPSVRSL